MSRMISDFRDKFLIHSVDLMSFLFYDWWNLLQILSKCKTEILFYNLYCSSIVYVFPSYWIGKILIIITEFLSFLINMFLHL
jgi:hypothetical protein